MIKTKLTTIQAIALTVIIVAVVGVVLIKERWENGK